MLAAWDGLDHRRTAEILQTTAATATVRLFRARRRFAAALAAGDHPAPAIDGTRPAGSLAPEGTT
jgi:DNA-directed RNA polymerase specialized sigma24 family protein